MSELKIALAQINMIVGDLPGNAEKIKKTIAEAKMHDADIVLFPELSLCAYPPQDLILDKDFLRHADTYMQSIVAAVPDEICALVGSVFFSENQLYNAVYVIQGAKVTDIVKKTHLPTYDIFDEARYFNSGQKPQLVSVMIREKNYKLGIEICEDLWDESYNIDVTRELAGQGADLILNVSASPFCRGKLAERRKLVTRKVRENNLPFVYLNLIGAQDEIIFDGGSFAVNPDGKTVLQLASFREELVYCTYKEGGSIEASHRAEVPGEMEALHGALILGIRDYFSKSAFRDAVIGLSGGIDSALVATLAAEALGSEHVYGYAMPSVFSSDHSFSDAETLARNIGMHFDTIPIHDINESFLDSLKKPFTGTEAGLAEENLQARIRGSILMSIANKKNALVLTTGNKTEVALGYCTLYGDMCGALAPISDLSKPEVYRLSHYINEQYGFDYIPENTLIKRPSAELAENQYDPFDYDVVGPLVEDILYSSKGLEQLIDETGDKELVYRIYKLIRLNEYKRRQAAPGLKVSPKAFGSGRKMPLVNHYRPENL